jgi:N6-adenosine-specific RNA methylase IME4
MIPPFTGWPHNHYRVIHADPPWHFHAWSHRGEKKGAVQHYPCMSLKDICALPVADIAAEDAALFLWVVQPMLPEAMRVIEAWGFEFRTVAFVWVKMPASWTPDQARIQPRLGLGYHTRSGAEQCWLAIRGKGYKRVKQGVEQVLHAPIREHSRKPDEIAQRIVELTGDLPRIELFARHRRPGWDAWGNQVNTPEEEREIDEIFEPFLKPYNGADDFARSYEVCLAASRERMLAGGPGWTPKPFLTAGSSSPF